MLLITSAQEPGGKLRSGLRSPLWAQILPMKLKCCGPFGSLASSAHLSWRGMPSAKIELLIVIQSLSPWPLNSSDRTSVVKGKRGYVRLDLVGRGIIKEKHSKQKLKKLQT